MLKIRLRRMGATHRPFYRIVVSDARKVPSAPAVEELGYYDPLPEPEVLQVDRDRVQYWVNRGAKLSETVARLVAQKDPAPSS